MRLTAILLAVITTLACSLAWGQTTSPVVDATTPHTAVLWWSDGESDEVPLTEGSLCGVLSDALRLGRWVPIGREGLRLTGFACTKKNSFEAGWGTIKGYNDRASSKY